MEQVLTVNELLCRLIQISQLGHGNKPIFTQAPELGDPGTIEAISLIELNSVQGIYLRCSVTPMYDDPTIIEDLT